MQSNLNERSNVLAFHCNNWGKSLHYFNLSNLLLQMKIIFNMELSLCSSTYNIYSTFFPQLESTKNNEYNNSLKNVWLLELFRSKKSTKVAACIREVAATFVVKTRQLSKKSPQESYRLGVNLTTLWNDLKFCFLKKKSTSHNIGTRNLKEKLKNTCYLLP